jgi:hypothetical protein
MLLRAVIVIYRCQLAEAASFLTLTNALRFAGVSPEAFELTVWDNSPEPQEMPRWDYPIRYSHDSSNSGLVPAYNRAAQACLKAGCEWLLLLDQDTRLPEDYFDHFFRAVGWVQDKTVAIVPRIRAAGKMVSPVRIVHGIVGIRVLDPTFQGPRDLETSTINSGAFVRVSFIHAISGYPERYSLDAVDLWFFAEAYARGRNLYVMPVWIEHELSITDIRSISLQRWRNIMRSEVQFYRDTRPRRVQLSMSALAAYRALTVLSVQKLPRHALVSLAEAARLGFHALARAPSR